MSISEAGGGGSLIEWQPVIASPVILTKMEEPQTAVLSLLKITVWQAVLSQYTGVLSQYTAAVSQYTAVLSQYTAVLCQYTIGDNTTALCISTSSLSPAPTSSLGWVLGPVRVLPPGGDHSGDLYQRSSHHTHKGTVTHQQLCTCVYATRQQEGLKLWCVCACVVLCTCVCVMCGECLFICLSVCIRQI